MNKKMYSKPLLKSESIEIGVFGCYGSTSTWTPVKIWNPLFGWCCS
ncbi:MAG: hypothetical protein JXB50_00720 [Spirochaetes bacterium]|nr:hypothetical protein [Spirochaetota bacterium]